MCFLNGWHPFESIRFDLVKINTWRCLVLQIWEQQKQRLRKQRVIQLSTSIYMYVYIYISYTGSVDDMSHRSDRK